MSINIGFLNALWMNLFCLFILFWVLTFQLFINKYLWDDYQVAGIIQSPEKAEVDKTGEKSCPHETCIRIEEQINMWII